jgi:hypothetical protein
VVWEEATYNHSLQARIAGKSVAIYREESVFRVALILLPVSIDIFLPVAFAANLANGQESPVVPRSKEQIRVITNEANLAVTATNIHGEFIIDFEQKDFHVFDDGVEQVIDRWDSAGDPLTVALVIETSSRVRGSARAIHGIASIFTETVMAINGEVRHGPLRRELEHLQHLRLRPRSSQIPFRKTIAVSLC